MRQEIERVKDVVREKGNGAGCGQASAEEGDWIPAAPRRHFFNDARYARSASSSASGSVYFFIFILGAGFSFAVSGSGSTTQALSSAAVSFVPTSSSFDASLPP